MNKQLSVTTVTAGDLLPGDTVHVGLLYFGAVSATVTEVPRLRTDFAGHCVWDIPCRLNHSGAAHTTIAQPYKIFTVLR